MAAAVITVLIWTSFILIARASADPARGGLLTPLDMAYCRIIGAALLLLPWGAYLVQRDRADGMAGASWLGLIVLGDLLVGGLSLLRAFDGGQVWLGDLLFMSAALCWATYSVLARHHRLDAVRATIAVTTFAAVSYVPLYSMLALTGAVQSHVFTAPFKEVLFQMLFQGWGSVVISGITFTQMIRYFGPVRSTMITALVPGLSAIGAVLLLGEPLQWNLVAGLVLVTTGILFGVRAASLAGSPCKAARKLQPSAGH
jgi:drug/metabolite transporter (DMT)-like permease